MPFKLIPKKTKVFLGFLLLSFFIWILMELTNVATSKVFFTVEYIHMPKGKMFYQEPTRELKASVKATGFSLLEYKLKNQSLQIDISKIYKGKDYLQLREYITILNKQLPSDINLLEVYPDSLFIGIGTRITKKVPVKLNDEVTYELGYYPQGGFTIIPDSITVSGADKDISQINEVVTDVFVKEKVQEDINEEVNLVKLTNTFQKISYSYTTVKVVNKVQKLTEGTIKMPVKVINIPDGISVTPIPNTVDVVYQADFAHFSKITKDNVQIVYDYQQYANDTLLQYLSPVVLQKSNKIVSLKTIPSQIEFLIQK